jgi:hypothetical protein
MCHQNIYPTGIMAFMILIKREKRPSQYQQHTNFLTHNHCFKLAYFIIQITVPFSSNRYLEANFMIIDKNGKTVGLDSVIEVNNRKYTVVDIDGNFIVATPLNNGVKRRFSISDLAMTNTDGGDEKRKKFIDARIKLRDYWEG